MTPTLLRLLLTVAPLPGLTGGLPFCSVGYGGVLAADAVFFIAAPRADTVAVGLGATNPSDRSGHFGSTARAEAYGQLVEIQRVGGPGSAGAPQSYRRAVVVPWDYDETCQPTLWTRSARFLPEVPEVFVAGRLRAEEHWVDGLPTFDAFRPQLDVFPLRLLDRFGGPIFEVPADESTVQDMFATYALLPTSAAVAASGRRSVEALVQWARANPETASKDPVADVVEHAVRAADRAWARSVRSPLQGTYEVRVTLPSGSVHTVALRTAAAPEGSWHRGQIVTWVRDPTLPSWESDVVGVRITVWAASSTEGLPAETAAAWETPRGGMLSVAEPSVAVQGLDSWRGYLDLEVFRYAMPGGPEIDALLDADRARRKARMFEPDPDSQSVVFTRGPDGSVEFRSERVLDGYGPIQLIGRQLSTVTTGSRAP